MEAPAGQLFFPKSILKTMLRREITEEQVRYAVARAYWTEKTGPKSWVCTGELEDGRILRVQYAASDEGRSEVLHASFAERQG